MDRLATNAATRNKRASPAHGAPHDPYGVGFLVEDARAPDAFPFQPDLLAEGRDTASPAGIWRPTAATKAVFGLVLGACVLAWATRHHGGLILQRSTAITLPWKTPPPTAVTFLPTARIGRLPALNAGVLMSRLPPLRVPPAAEVAGQQAPAATVPIDVLVLTRPGDAAALLRGENLVERLRRAGHSAALVQTGKLRADAAAIGYYYQQDRALALAVASLLGGQPGVHLVAAPRGSFHKPGSIVVMLPQLPP